MLGIIGGGGGQESRFSVGIVLSHSTGTYLRGTLWCVTNFGHRKILCLRGLCHDFRSNCFCLTVPKNFVGEPFCVSQNFWYRKILWIREGEGRGKYHDFLSKILSHSVEEPFCVCRGTLLCFRKFLVSKNVKDNRGGGYHDFPSKLFCLTVPNHFVDDLFCLSESFGYRKILCLRREYHDFI